MQKSLEVEVDWMPLASKMHVVRLGWAVRLLIPSLLISSIPVQTRGMTFHTGRWGLLLGAVLVAGEIYVGALLEPLFGYAPLILLSWLLGSTGIALGITAFKPIAFVKPICTRCRLLPIIKEHEAIHLAGVGGEKEVWASMKTRHSVESLSLEGDPGICSFCPIPKRLRE